MELVAAVAIGLNPYVGTFMLAALAAYSRHLPGSAAASAVPPAALVLVMLLAGCLAPVDLVLGKFLRFAPWVRRISLVAALAGGALAAVLLTQSEAPLAVAATEAVLVSGLIAALLTTTAARASRSPAWVGLGHLPVLMAAAAAAACIVPLSLVKPGIGTGVSLVATGLLLWGAAGTFLPAARTRAGRVARALRAARLA